MTILTSLKRELHIFVNRYKKRLILVGCIISAIPVLCCVAAVAVVVAMWRNVHSPIFGTYEAQYDGVTQFLTIRRDHTYDQEVWVGNGKHRFNRGTWYSDGYNDVRTYTLQKDLWDDVGMLGQPGSFSKTDVEICLNEELLTPPSITIDDDADCYFYKQ
jgi:hypothetical protein